MKNIFHIVKMMATAIAVAFIVYSCKGKLDKAETLNLEETPMQTVDNMFIVQTENGILKMRVEAGIMQRYDRDTMSYELFPEGLAVYGYTDEGLLETEITSDNARHVKRYNGEEIWEAFGNVVVRNIIKKQVMETDTLYWDRLNEKIYTHCYVEMYSPDGLMQGYGMESDQHARNANILKPFNSYGLVVQDTSRVEVDSVNFIGPLLKK